MTGKQVEAALEADALRFPGFLFYVVLNDPSPTRLQLLAEGADWSAVVEILSSLASVSGSTRSLRDNKLTVIRSFTGQPSGYFSYFYGMRLHILMLLGDGTAAPPAGWPAWRDVQQCHHCGKFYITDGPGNLANYTRHVAACGAKAAPKRRRDGPGSGSAAKRPRTS